MGDVMRQVVPALAAMVIATLGTGSAAQAKFIDFGVVAFGGTLSYTGGTLSSSTALNLDGAELLVSEVKPGESSGLTVGDTVTVTTGNIPPTNIIYGSGNGGTALVTDVVKTWTDSLGTFTETLDEVEAINRLTKDAITVTLTGWLDGPGFDNTPVSLILQANQDGGIGNTVSASLTNATTVPEPPTWLMLGLGFAGLGYAAVRRSSKNRSALAI